MPAEVIVADGHQLAFLQQEITVFLNVELTNTTKELGHQASLPPPLQTKYILLITFLMIIPQGIM